MGRSVEGSSGMNNDIKYSKRGSCLVGQKMFLIMDAARVIEERGERVYHLELGNPRLAPPPEIMSKAIDSIRRLEVGYTYSSGHPILRKAIAKLVYESWGRPATEVNVVISPANLIINQFLDLVCDPGDRVVFFTPAFPTYWAAAAHIGLFVESVALDPATSFDLTDEAVSRALALRPRAIIVNSANNPTGAVYSRATLVRLAEKCEELGIWLLSDETYGEVSFSKRFESLLQLDLPHLVVMGSFSKIFSIPGFRVGFLVAHPEVAKKFSLSVSTLISCLPIFTQLGCAAGIRVISEYTADVRNRCASITARCTKMLQESSRISFSPPSAGFYFFLNLESSGMDDITFAEHLLKVENTAVTPGSSFGLTYNSFIRIATCGHESDVLEGTSRLVRFVESL